MAKYLYNTTENNKTYVGLEVPSEDYLLIPYNLESKFANTSALLTDIGNGDVIVSKSDNESQHLTSVNDGINYLKDLLPKDIAIASIQAGQLPFASKVLPDGKKLYKRVHGISAVVAGAPDNITFTVPYPNCKLTGIEVIGGIKGDKVNLKILDSTSGVITGIPNYVLNQFGFDVNISEGFYEHRSEYDADLVQNLQIRLEYDSVSADLLPNTIYINFILNEVKA